jgi:hypothetical protein
MNERDAKVLDKRSNAHKYHTLRGQNLNYNASDIILVFIIKCY